MTSEDKLFDFECAYGHEDEDSFRSKSEHATERDVMPESCEGKHDLAGVEVGEALLLAMETLGASPPPNGQLVEDMLLDVLDDGFVDEFVSVVYEDPFDPLVKPPKLTFQELKVWNEANHWPRKCASCHSLPVYPGTAKGQCDFCLLDQALPKLYNRRRIQSEFLTEMAGAVRTWLLTMASRGLGSVSGVFGAAMQQKITEGWASFTEQLPSKTVSVLAITVAILIVAIICKVASSIANISVEAVKMILKAMVAAGFTFCERILLSLSNVLRKKDEGTQPLSLIVPESDPSLGAGVYLLSALITTLSPTISGYSATGVLKAITSAKSVLTGVGVMKVSLDTLISKLPQSVSNTMWDHFKLGVTGADADEREFIVGASYLLSEMQENVCRLNEYSKAQTVVSTYETLLKVHTNNIALRSNSMQRIVSKLLSEFQEFHRRAVEIVSTSSHRVEPVGIWLWSDPGAGKSHAVSGIAAKLFPHVVASKRVYTPTNGVAYDNGYSGEPMFFIDEVTATGGKSTTETMAKLLSYISVANVNMNMAAVEDKGRMFLSRLVFCAANTDLDRKLGLTEDDALRRRFSTFKLTLKPEWKTRNGVLDTDRIRQHLKDKLLTEEECLENPWQVYTPMRYNKTNEVGSRYTPMLDEFGRKIEWSYAAFQAFIASELEKKQQAYEHNLRITEHIEAKYAVSHDGPAWDKKGMATLLPNPGGLDAGELEESDDKHSSSPGATKKEKAPEEEGPEAGGIVAQMLAADFIVDTGSAGSDSSSEEEAPKQKKRSPAARKRAANFGAARKTETPKPEPSKKETKEEEAKAKKSKRKKDSAGYYDQILAMSSLEVQAGSDAWDCRSLELIDSGQESIVRNAEIFRKAVYLRDLLGCQVAKIHRFSRASYERLWSLHLFSQEAHWKKTAKYAFAGGTAAALAVVIYKGFTRQAEEVLDVVAERTEGSHSIPRPTRMPVSRIPGLPKIGRPQRAQMSTDALGPDSMVGPDVDDGIRKALYGNIVKIKVPSGRNYGYYTCGSFLFTTLHTFMRDGKILPEGEIFIIEDSKGVSVEMAFVADDFCMFPETSAGRLDICAYNTKNAFSPFKDIRKFLTTSHNLKKLMRRKFYMAHHGKFEGIEDLKNVTKQLEYVTDGVKLYANNYLEYNECSEYGDCGALIIAPKGGDTLVIVGHHMAKDTCANKSLGQVVTKELVDALIEAFGTPPDPHSEIEVALTEVKHSRLVPRGRLPVGRIADRKLVGGSSGHTKYRPSEIAGEKPFCDLGFAPATQKTKELSNNAIQVMRKEKPLSSGLHATSLDPIYLSQSRSTIEAMCSPIYEVGIGGVLTWDEVVNGGGRYPGVSQFPRDTSIGFPDKFTMKKEDVLKFDVNTSSWFIEPSYQDHLVDLERRVLVEGVSWVFESVSKDEILPKAKVDAADTRCITVCPMEFNLLMKKYFGAYFDAHMRTVGRTPFCVGLDPSSGAWDRMFRRLLNVSPLGFDGDYKGFEYMHTHQAFDSFLAHIENYYARVSGKVEPEHVLMRRRLLSAAQHCHIKLGDVVHATSSELASGVWLTLIINCYFSALYLLYAYYDIADSSTDTRQYANVTACADHLAISVMGDDNLTAVAPEIGDWFNGAAVQNVLRGVGRGFTPADKDMDFGENRDLLTCGFLSGETLIATYKEMPALRYHYALDELKCLRQIAWVSKDAEERGLEDNINSALRAYWPRGKAEFENLRETVIAHCRKHNYKLNPISYECELLRRVQMEKDHSIESESEFLDGAKNSFGRLYKLRHFTSAEWVRFFATVTVYLKAEEPVLRVLKISNIRSGHPIIDQRERDTLEERAKALIQKYDGDREAATWFERAGVTSTAGLMAISEGEEAVMMDGNNRLAALRLACAALGLPEESISWVLPCRPKGDGCGEVLWDCAQSVPEATCRLCVTQDCDCRVMITRIMRGKGIRSEMEVEVHDNDDHTVSVVNAAPGAEIVPDAASGMKETRSILDVAKRYGTVSVPASNPSSTGGPALGGLCGAFVSAGAPRNKPAGLVMDMYAMFAGSISKMVYSSEDFLVGAAVGSIPDLSDNTNGNNNGLMPYIQGTKLVSYQGIQIPFLSRFNGVLIPRTPSEAGREEYTCGNLSYASLGSGIQAWETRVMAAMGDDAMVWGLYRVPRQRVTGTAFPHNDKANDVPSAIIFRNNIASQPGGIKQEWTLSQEFPARGVIQDGPMGLVESVEIDTELMTNAELANFGFPVPTGNRRPLDNWKPTIERDLSNMRSFPGTIIGRAGVTGTVAVDSFTASPVGSSYVRLVGVQPVDIATEHIFDYSNYIHPSFRAEVGLTPSQIAVPSGISQTVNFSPGSVETVDGLTFTMICKNKAILIGATAVDSTVVTRKHENVYTGCIVSEMQKTEGVGVSFVEDGETSRARVARAPATMLPPTMSGGDYSYGDILSRMTKVATTEWSQSAAPFSVLASYSMPFDMFRGAVTRVIKRFQYFRGDVVIRFNVQSSPFHSGKVIASFLPLRNDGPSRTEHTSSLTNLTLNQHCLLFAGDNSSVELKIPWLHIKSMLEPNNPTGEIPLGTLSLVVVNPLVTGVDNLDPVQISTFVSFENVGLKVLRSNADIVSEMGFLSGLGENINKAISSTIDVVSSVSSLAGLSRDRPNVGQSAEAAIRQGLPYVCNAVGVQQNAVMALYPDEVVNPSQGMVGTTVNETHVDYLYSKFTQYATYAINDQQRFGDVICVGNMCPIQKLDGLGFQESTQESLLGYISSWHTYWTGELEFKFEFVGTRYHKMRFVFCYHYGSESSRLEGDEAMQQFIVMYDYSYDNPTLTVKIPWRLPTSMLKVPPGSDVFNGIHSGGQWSLRVDSPMVAMESVSTELAVNVFIRGGDGFKLLGLYDNCIDYTNLTLEEV